MKTYLNGSVKNGIIIRWPINHLTVYIAPMKFYSKPGEDTKFRKMVIDALNMWSSASGGKLHFKITNNLYDSNINVVWKRVERTALGHCNYSWDSGRLYGAEVSIGLTDGRIHKQYDNDIEVYHTILHEIGHALGLLGHSPYPEDIMYTPHQYGNASLSANDKHSIQWLYKFPVGTSVKSIASKYGISTSTDIDSVIRKIESKEEKKHQNTYKEKLTLKTNRDLLEEASNIGDLKKYNMMLQNISISDNVKKYLNNNR